MSAGGGLDARRLATQLTAVDFVRRVVVLKSTGSTNDDVRRLAAEGAPEGTVVIAERQSAGRGRLGRAWESPEGLGLYLSVLLRPEDPADRLGRYAIASAVAVCTALREAAGAGVVLKWPNDLLADGRKLAGVLAELRQGPEGAELTIGIGVNVNQLPEDFSPEISGQATSLRIIGGGTPLARETFAAGLLRSLAAVIAQLRADAWAEVVLSFLRYAPDATGRRVRLASGRCGVTAGLDASGALAVSTAAGIELAHASESVTPI